MATNVTPGVGAAALTGFGPAADLSGLSLPISEVQHAAVDVTALGTNTLVAAVAGNRIRVVALALVASGGANTAELQSDTRTLSDPMDLANNGQFVLPYNPAGWCETGTGEPLNLDLSAATAVAGVIGYVLVET